MDGVPSIIGFYLGLFHKKNPMELTVPVSGNKNGNKWYFKLPAKKLS